MVNSSQIVIRSAEKLSVSETISVKLFDNLDGKDFDLVNSTFETLYFALSNGCRHQLQEEATLEHLGAISHLAMYLQDNISWTAYIMLGGEARFDCLVASIQEYSVPSSSK